MSYQLLPYTGSRNRTMPVSYSLPGFTAGPSRVLSKRRRISRTMTMSRRKGRRTGVVTTAQRDFVNQYVRKRAPLRVRRRARRSFRIFQKNSLRLVGTNTFVKNSQVNMNTATAYPQVYGIVSLGALNGTNAGAETGAGDINDLFSNDTRISTGSGKVLIKNMACDVTLYNGGAGETKPIEVDVYILQYRNGTKRLRLSQMIADAEGITGQIGPAAGITMINRGVQLFDLPALMKMGIQVLRKTKIFLPVGNTATFRFASNRSRWLSTAEDIQDNIGFVKPGFTQSMVIAFKNVIGTGDTSYLTMGCTRRYVYKVFEDDQDKDGIS